MPADTDQVVQQLVILIGFHQGAVKLLQAVLHILFALLTKRQSIRESKVYAKTKMRRYSILHS